MEEIRQATISPVHAKKLTIGDKVLFRNFVLEVTDIQQEIGKLWPTVTITNGDITQVTNYVYYYRIEESLMDYEQDIVEALTIAANYTDDVVMIAMDVRRCHYYIQVVVTSYDFEVVGKTIDMLSDVFNKFIDKDLLFDFDVQTEFELDTSTIIYKAKTNGK